MQLGFVSAILPDLPLEDVISFAADEGFDCVELMCWPMGKAERRYAGVTHIDVNALRTAEAVQINNMLTSTGVTISGLGYYPNPLAPKARESKMYVEHIKSVVLAAEMLGVNLVNTFVGRDWTRSVDDNWPRFKKIWRPLVRSAAKRNVKIAIENCPMYFTDDEWPGGKNLAVSPAIWRRMFSDISAPNFGLNYDPSHMIIQHMDYVRPLREFGDRIFHVHAKDARIDRARLDDVGILAPPNQYHTPKLPGLGDVEWGRFFSALTDSGFQGAVCVEVEDRAYEGSLDRRKDALRQSANYLRQFIPKSC